MDQRLIKHLLQRPGTWWNCLRIAKAVLMHSPRVTLRSNELRIQAGLGNGEGLFCAISGDEYEPEMPWFLRQLKPGKIFIDVGANIGIYSLRASRILGPDGKVIAFEPTPETFKMLSENIQLNSVANIEAIPKAVGNICGTLFLVSQGRPASNSTSATKSDKGMAVEAITLDQFCADRPGLEIDYIKVDIEGGEHAFFEGARTILLRDKPLVLFESEHTGPQYPERQFLRALGYHLYRLLDGTLRPVGEDREIQGNLIALWPTREK